MKKILSGALLLGAATLGAAVHAAPLDYPATPKVPVVDTYFGTQVTDNYRWLESTDTPEVKTWIAAQNALTHSVLDAFPQRAALKQELLGMIGGDRVSRSHFVFAGGQVFGLKYQPP